MADAPTEKFAAPAQAPQAPWPWPTRERQAFLRALQSCHELNERTRQQNSPKAQL